MLHEALHDEQSMRSILFCFLISTDHNCQRLVTAGGVELLLDVLHISGGQIELQMVCLKVLNYVVSHSGVRI